MKLISTLFAGLIVGPLLAQQSMQISLQQAQDYAVAHAYSVENNELEVKKARQVYLENFGRGLPQISASGNYTYNIERQSFVADLGGQLGLLQIGAPYTALGTINADQLLFDGSYIVAVLASKVLKENAENNLEKSQIEIKEQVARAYHLVLVSKQTQDILEKDLSYMQQSFEETKKLYENGFVEETDKDQLELLVSNLVNNIDYNEKQGVVAKMLLKIAMGVPLETTLELTDNIETLMAQTANGTSLLEQNFNVENHIEYRNLLTQEHGQQLNVRNENMQYLPKLRAFYNFNYNINNSNAWVLKGTEGEERLDVRWQALGVGISVPILSGGTKNARVKQAELTLQQVDVAKKQLADNLMLAYTQAQADYEFALNNYNTQQRNAEIAKNIRDKTMRKYQEGLATSLELTQVENQYQQSLRNALGAANQVLDKKVNLAKVLGQYNN